MNDIILSVVMASYNRKKLLVDQLERLTNQTFPEKNYEIIVVDDGSTDGTFDALRKWDHPNLTVVSQSNRGPAAARNSGLKEARGKWIAFTDDDCLVHEDWLENIFNELEGSDFVGLQGYTYTTKHAVTPLTHQVENKAAYDVVPTCNAAYRRTILNRVGGFDENFPYPHNEDTDLSWRVQQLGNITFSKKVKVYHPPRQDKVTKIKRRMRVFESEFLLYQKHPDLYKKYRDRSPLRHIYHRILHDVLRYGFLSNINYWRRPKLMFAGLYIGCCWLLDLVFRYPTFKAMQSDLST